MTSPSSVPNDVTRLLTACEDEGTAPAYVMDDPIRRLSVEGGDLIVVSDLHLADGLDTDGRYSGTENFFADGSFDRFLADVRRRVTSRPAWLVINGDVIDFMRITGTPRSDEDFARWESILEDIGLRHDAASLRQSIIDKERTFGLRTDDFKSVWKLDRSLRGHPGFLSALADWMQAGHRLIIVRGNHDLEWYWPAVRNSLRLAIAREMATRSGDELAALLRSTVLPHLYFIHDRLIVDESMLIEHGHVFDKFTNVVGAPTVGDGTELNLPFGSFFNRYLINHIELDYPFVDNVRPRESLLPMLVRERFPLALKLLCYHLPFALRVIPKHYYWYIFGRVIWLILAILVPVGILIWQLWDVLAPLFTGAQSLVGKGSILAKIWQASQSMIWLIVSYFLARLVAWLQLEEPSSLNSYAAQRFDEMPGCRIMTFGHTHNPDQFESEGRWFYNTGTWVPIIEQSSADIRFDRTFTFLHFKRLDGSLHPTFLERWDDDAGRAEPMALVRKKDG